MAITFNGISIGSGVALTITPPPSAVYLWSWGRNHLGQLGQGDTTNQSSPIQIGALTTWSAISGTHGNHSMAIKTDGTMWSWGRNNMGQLGQGDTTNRSSPVQIGALTNWLTISSGYTHSMAIKTDGTMWSWGDNTEHGQLGLGNKTSISSPVQIGALTTWSKIGVGMFHNLAIKTDGTLWGWGNNNYNGSLGLGNKTTSYSSPIQIGSLTTWSSVSAGSYFSLAIKTDGTLWSWGYNSQGQLGLGDTTERLSPVQVGLLTNWSSVNSGANHVLAVKTDGTIWSWGYNSYNNFGGRLGLGDTTHRSSPTQIGALTNWSSISGGGYHSLAMKTDGTLWTWGANYHSTLGLGNTTHRSSPTQIGALTTWLKVSASRYHNMAIG
jgi:alpha-tubulin suppressor-like RCC1 family protein